jgi:hypothetical protein
MGNFYNSERSGFISFFSKIVQTKAILMLLFVLFSGVSAIGQVTVTASTGTTLSASYTTLASAISAINDGTTHTGTVLCEVIAGHTEVAPVGGFTITATGSAGNTITFVKSGAGANPEFTASPALTAGSLTDAIFKIVGGDFISIGGFTMLENTANTTIAAATNNMTEFGVALFYATATDGCQNVTIRNCTIDLTRAYQNTFGIYANSTHTATVVTTSATATGATGGNSNLTITGNTITDVNQAISVVGPTAAADQNDGLVIGGLGLGNTITNYGTTGTFSAYANVSGTVNGILVRNTKNYTISYNSISSSVGGTTVGTLRGIFVNAFSNAPIGTFTNTVSFNTLDIKSGLITGAVSGIVLEGTSASTTSTMNVNSNTFNGLSHTTATASGTLIFIQQVGPHLNVSVSNNTFNSLMAITTGGATFISASYTMPAGGTQVYNNNTITGGFNKTGAGSTVTGYTSGSSSPTGSTHTSTGNNFSGITVTGATAITGWSTSDGLTSSSPTKTFSGNTFTNWTGGTSSVVGISFNYGNSNSVVTNNVINNITSAGSITGISLGTSNTGTVHTVSNNTVTNLTSTGTGTGFNINGIAIGAHSVTAVNVSNNIVNTFNNASSTGQVIAINASAGATGTTNVFNHEVFGINASGVTPLLGGIAALGTAGTINIYANKIHTLNASGATTNNGATTGLVLQGGLNVNCYNNIIGGLINPLGSGINSIMGIQVQSTVAGSTYKIYNNSVFLNATSTGTNFGTSGLFHAGNATATIGALDMVNNIIINQSSFTGTGITVAIRRSLAALNNYATTSNRNLLFAGTPSATNVIYNDGTTSYQTISDFKTIVSTRETNSFTSEGTYAFQTPGSFFISTTESNVNFLKPVAGITTQAESGGVTFPSIFTTDFAGVIRGGNVGYSGSGTNPDLGAFEFAGVTPAPIIVLNSVTPAATQQCVTTSRLVSVTVTPSSGTLSSVNLNYAFNGVAQTTIAMTNTSGNIWEGTLPASTPTNATVTWSVSATNSVPLTSTFNGSTYKDEPLFGVTATVTAANTTVCAGSPTTLTAVLGSANPANYTAPPAVTAPTVDEDLGNITITNTSTSAVVLNNTSAINSLTGTVGVASGTAGSYSNFTSFGPYGLTAGTNYTFSLSSLQSASPYPNSMAIYIDYNRNGVFTDPGENVYVATATTSGTHTETGNFTVPASAFNGLTRMRVICNEGLITGPTMSVSYGEFEEYTLNITSANNGGGLAPTITSVSWSNGTTTVGTTNNLVVNPTATTTYTATIMASGCSVSPSPAVTVTVNPLPTAPTATNSVQCGAQAPTAAVADPNAFTTPTFKWYADNTTTTALQAGIFTTYQTSISATTTFYVSVLNPTTLCESTRTAVVVTVTAPQAITLNTTNTVSGCLGSPTAVTASSANTGYTYSWTASPVSGSGISGTVSGASQTFTPTALGTYVYTVTGTDGVCTATKTLTINVNSVPSAVTVTPATTNCANAVATLSATGGAINNLTILSENFNAATNSWTTTNNSTGGTPANIAWTLTPSPFDYGFYGMFSSNDATQFYLSNNDAGGGGSIANTALTSPSFSTVNFVSATVSFWHYFRNPGDAKVEYSVNGGTNWNTVQTFTTTVGAVGAFVQENVVLPAGALNQSNVQVRFKYDTTGWEYFWALDNVTISGSQSTSIVWSPVTNLFTDAAATIAYTGSATATVYYKSATAAAATTYTATATSTANCSSSGTTTVTTIDCEIQYANLQFPGTATISTCDSQTFYAQVYKAGVTETAGQGSGITAWIGRNTSNTDPATWAESSWQLATFNVQSGNNDEYQSTFSSLAAGTYYVASRFVFTPGNFVYGGYTSTSGGFWGGSNVSAVLTVNAVAQPTATSPQTFCNGATVANLSATGTNLQWYTSSTGGTALASVTALVTADYYVSQTLNSCESTRTLVAVTVNTTAAPTATSPQTFCNGATVANLSATGTNLQWYTTSTGGTALASSTLLATGNYYVSQTLNSCESARTLVSVVVNTTAAPTATSPQTFCNGATVVNLSATGTNLQWYTSSTSGTALASSTLLATGNYYVSQTLNSCESTRTLVAVTVNTTAAPTATSPQTFCNGATVANLSATGTNLQWYTTSTGGTALASSTLLATGNYYVSQTLNSCESTRTLVAVTVNTTAAPTATSPQSFVAPATIANIVITGSNIIWYATLANATAATNPLPTTTTLVDNTTYYATQTINGCPSAATAVLVNVTLRNTAFNSAALSYYPNPTRDVITFEYSNAISNLRVINMLGQEVRTKKYNSTSVQLDLNGLASGTYIVEITSEGLVKQVKVVKAD